LKEELECSKQSKWVCAGDFNCHHSLWDGNGRELAGSWREVKEFVEFGRLMIEPGTPTWKGGTNHRTSTIDLVIASDAANISMVEVASDLYTGSDHETLCWEIDEGKSYETRKAGTTG
jgi:endonuclease/exonuclease/phosphatase family metal-dependent hydrolase